MATSLAAQLATRRTTTALSQTLARTHTSQPSLVYHAKHAASLSLVDVLTQAQLAWDTLESVDRALADDDDDDEGEGLRDVVVGDHTLELDRSQLDRDQDERLASKLEYAIRRLAKHALLRPTALVLDWLLRRFRCVPPLLWLATLAYHD